MKKKIFILLACIGLMGAISVPGAIALSYHNEPMAVLAEGEDSSSSDTGEITEDDEKTMTEQVKEWWDTYLVPILGSVSIASVVSAVVSIALAILNRKTNIKNRTEIIDVTTIAGKLINSVTSLVIEIKTSNAVTEATKIAFETSSKELLEKVAMLSGKTEQLTELKAVMINFSAIYAKIAANTKELVALGVAEDCQKLLEQIKHL